MKRLLLIVLVLAFTSPLFADDALTLPTGVWRTRVVPIYSFTSSEFEEGEGFTADRESSDIESKALLLGFAVEYGITDWITAAVQWTPAVTAWSEIDAEGSPFDGDPLLHRWSDIFVGAKVQIIGPQAPVSRSDIRLAVAPGIKIPLPGADWDDELESAMDGDDFVFANVDRNVFGIGGRFYLDYVFSPEFFVNLYSEFIAYPVEGAGPNVFTAGTDDKWNYGYDLTLEIEPHYIYTASADLRITPSLPITFTHSPGLEYDGEPTPARMSRVLTVEPTVEFFFTGLTVPTALEIGYRYPVAGQNAGATNALVIQIKNYLKFW